MKEIATSQYDFAVLREGDRCVYVDKTDILAKLGLRQDAHYFISRPRRFGKSLMLSTLRYMFEGRRDLFKGLKIEKTKWDWSKTYPVIMLNMSEIGGDTPEDIESGLYSLACDIARKFNLRPKKERSSGKFFSNVLEELSVSYGKFVVLVDEYDVPLQGFLDDRRAIRRVRKIMHDFYVQLKNNIGSIRFLMITGVTKLTKLSLFSGLNNPADLTMDEPLCAGLLGYAKDEIRTYFSDWLAALAKKRKKSTDAVLQELLDWYDSYRFCPDSKIAVCNPISVGKALRTGKLKSYWIKTASASLLVERMRALNATVSDFENVLATDDELDVCDAIEMPLVPLAYQSGYLTIKGMSRTEKDSYGNPKLLLGIPNHEVRGALNGVFWDALMQMKESDFTALVHTAERQIAKGDIEGLLNETLFGLYAKLPTTWTPKNEADAKRYFLLFMEMAGAKMQPEKPSARGFADAVVETKKGVWVMEFKFNRSTASAIRQIRERGYADAYASKVEVKGRGRERNGSSSGSNSNIQTFKHSNIRPITLVGIKFDSNRRNIDIPKFEEL